MSVIAAAIAMMPAAARPAIVTVHLDPLLPPGALRVDGAEFHRPSRGLLVAEPTTVPTAVWLHELAHVRMLGPRPESEPARRLVQAMEEGAADYCAATWLGRADLGSRDLGAARRPDAGQWAALGLPDLAFDPHDLGLGWAAALWSIRPADPALAETLMTCLRDAPVRPTGVGPWLEAWLPRCRVAARPVIREALRAWLPDELQYSR